MNATSAGRRAPLGPLSLAVLAGIALGLSSIDGGAAQAQVPPAPAEVDGVGPVRAKVKRKGRISVLAQLPPGPGGGDLPPAASETARRQLARRLAAFGVAQVRGLGSLPYVALEVNERQLDALLASGQVVGVGENREVRAVLAESAPIVGAPPAWAQGARGAGEAVVVVDSGVQAGHPFLSGRVVRGVCSAADCGVAVVDRPGAGEPNPGCPHGTHVAGIAAGRGASFSGVAPDAGIISVRVLDCDSTSWDYVIRGLDHVSTTLAAQHRIAAVNLSLSDSSQHGAACDNADPAYQALATVIGRLRDQGIATVAATGNDGYGGGVSAPACIAAAVAVGGTTKADAVAAYSNSGANVELLAPGSAITSSAMGGGFAAYSGTSMAAPHVAGAIAGIRSGLPGKTVDQVERALETTGKPVTDADNAVARPRIDVAEALAALGGAAPAAWHAWERFGGDLASSPECLRGGATQVDCWARLSGGALGWWRYDGRARPALVSLGGRVASPPSCLQAGGGLHCFAALASGQLGQVTRTGGAWGGWRSLGDDVRGRPACVSADAVGITCVALGGTGRLRARTWSGGAWGGWSTVAEGLSFAEPPTCYARAGGIDCVAVDAAGRGQFLRRNPGGSWKAARKGLGGAVVGTASCIEAGAASRTCFFRGADRTLRRLHLNGASGQGTWENLGGTLDGAPSCVAGAAGAEARCFALGGGGELRQIGQERRGGAWGPWSGLGGSLAAGGAPACVAPSGGGARLDCFARGAGDQLDHVAYY